MGRFTSFSVIITTNLSLIGIGWMDELGFYVPSTVFQSFRDDGRMNERLCAMKRRLGSRKILPPAGFEPATP